MRDPLLVLKFVMFLKSKYFKVYLFVKIPSPHPWRDPVPPPPPQVPSVPTFVP